MNKADIHTDRWSLSVIVLILFLALGLALPSSSQPAGEGYAILIVGDEGNAEMLRQEKVLIGEMGKLLPQQPAEMRLPIYSYHFNKERERAYCETKLNVLSEDLLFVGVVKLSDKVPLKVVYRIDRISNPARAAKDILARAEEIVAEEMPRSVTTSPTPAPSVTPPPSEQAVGSGFRVQLGSFSQLKHAQDRLAAAQRADLEVEIVESKGPGGGTLFKVLSPLVSEREEADALLKRFHQAGFEEAFLARSGE